MKWLPAALSNADSAVEPCGASGATVLLDRLWLICPMPSDDALVVWVETLSKYPADLVKAAIDRVIETRTWERDPPLPAHVVAHIKPELSERVTKRNRLQAMIARAKRDGSGKNEPTGRRYSDLTAEERAEFDAKMDALKASLVESLEMPDDVKAP